MSHTVLVCDDAIFMRTMISDILQQAGFEVVGEAETGRQAVEKYDGQVVPARDPYDRPVFWLAVSPLTEHAPDTDLWAFERGYVTITPLRLDLTDHEALADQPAGERAVEFVDQAEPEVIADADEEDGGTPLPSAGWTDQATEEPTSTLS